MARPERKNINVETLEKVRKFLKEQDEPVFKSDIVKYASVDFHSVGLALTMLPVRINKDRRVKLR